MPSSSRSAPAKTSRPFKGTGRFQLVRQLGQGGMGVVYEAFDRERNARVALKTVQTLTADSLVRFKNEFRALQDLQHPNLVRLDELFEHDGTWFFSMELVDGVSFFEYVRPEDSNLGRMLGAAPRAGTETRSDSDRHAALAPAADDTADTRMAARVPGLALPAATPDVVVRARPALLDEARLRAGLRQLVLGLAALHDAQKVHRDIKPGNVLVTPEGRVVILDFGLVTDAFLAEGHAVGTGAFMAPEQGSGESVGPAADWYAVGVTLYLALTGRPPFTGTFEQVVELKRVVDPQPPAALVAQVPADLNLLCMELLRRAPAERPHAHEILACLGDADSLGPGPTRAAIFVGRDEELDLLEAAFAGTRRGRAAAILVQGESGVGKSALVKHFLARLGEKGRALVLPGRCYERESVPFKAVDQVIDALARALAALPDAEVLRLLPAGIELAADVFPVLAQVAVIARLVDAVAVREGSGDPLERRRVVFAGLRHLLGELARRGPLVLAIDDLQWSDADSLALLSELMAEPAPPPFLLLATVRTAGDVAALSVATLEERLGQRVRTLALAHLPPEAARELAARLLASVSGPATADVPALAADLADEGGGHPLFIDALTRHRLLHPRTEGPVRLDDALYARSLQLEPAAQRLLDMICVAGTPVQQEACAHAAHLPFGEFAHHVSALRAAHLVKTHGVHRGDRVEPYHDRVREAVLARLAGEARRGLHEQLGRALEASRQADDESLASHFREAGDARRAARYAVRAADQAARALAFARAARLYREALELDPGTASAHTLRARLAEALASAGHGRDSALAYLAAAEDAPPQATVELRRRAAEQFLRAGFMAEGLATYEAVLATIGLPLHRRRAEVLRSFVWQRLRLALRGYGHRRRAADDPVPAEALRRLDILRSAHSLGMTNIVASQELLTRYLREALDLGLPGRIADALATETIYVATAGRPAGARVTWLMREARTLAAQVDDPYVHAMADATSGVASYLFGRFRECVELCDRAERLWRERSRGAHWERDIVQLYGVRALAFVGDLGELGRRLDASLRGARERGDLYLETNLRVGFPIALACVARDDPRAALREGTEAIAAWHHDELLIEDFHDFQGQATAEFYAGDVDTAERRAQAIWPRLRAAMFLRIQLGRAVSRHLCARITLAVAERAQGKARTRRLAAVRRDARRLEAEDMDWIDPLATFLRAGAAALLGDDDTAADALARGEQAARASDLHLYAAAARLQRGRLAGGDEGRRLRGEGEADLRARGVVKPGRFAAMLVPGFGGAD